MKQAVTSCLDYWSLRMVGLCWVATTVNLACYFCWYSITFVWTWDIDCTFGSLTDFCNTFLSFVFLYSPLFCFWALQSGVMRTKKSIIKETKAKIFKYDVIFVCCLYFSYLEGQGPPIWTFFLSPFNFIYRVLSRFVEPDSRI